MSEPIGTLDIIEDDKTYQVKIFHSVGYMGCNCMNCKLGQGVISFDFYKGMAMQKYLDLLHSEDPDDNGLHSKEYEEKVDNFKKEFINPYFSKDEEISFIMS